jgi:hypothetical protein
LRSEHFVPIATQRNVGSVSPFWPFLEQAPSFTLYCDAEKGSVGAVSVKYIVVCIDEANQMEGCTFFELFHPDFAILLTQFNFIQHELPAITL